MCSCDEGTVCLAHRDTRHDPQYFETDDFEQPEPEFDHPSEFEVRDA